MTLNLEATDVLRQGPVRAVWGLVRGQDLTRRPEARKAHLALQPQVILRV